MNSSEIAIILVTFNSSATIKKCLNSIFEKTINIQYEIIVVDNASTDDTVEVILKSFPNIQLIANKNNFGFGVANNIGIKRAKSKYIFLLNPDTILINNAPRLFYEFMDNPLHKNIWCCGGNIYRKDMTPEITYGNFPSLKQIIFEFGIHKLFSAYYELQLSNAVAATTYHPKEVDYISGANMFIRKSLMPEQPFDTDFFLYYEETELSYRMKCQGYRSYLVPKAKIIHLHGESTRSLESIKKIHIIETSKYLFFYKSYGVLTMKIANLLYLLKYFLLWIKTQDSLIKEYMCFSFFHLLKFSDNSNGRTR